MAAIPQPLICSQCETPNPRYVHRCAPCVKCGLLIGDRSLPLRTMPIEFARDAAEYVRDHDKPKKQ